jgi:hypothetical protein
MTHFEAVYDQNPPSVLSYMAGVSKVQEVDTNLIVRRLFFMPSKTIWSWLKIA